MKTNDIKDSKTQNPEGATPCRFDSDLRHNWLLMNCSLTPKLYFILFLPIASGTSSQGLFNFWVLNQIQIKKMFLNPKIWYAEVVIR